MSPVADTDTVLFDSPANGLFGLAESLKKLTRHLENHSADARAHHGGGDDGEEGTGSAPVDILETKKEYTFFLDVPGLSKSDVQVTLEEEKVLVVRGGGKRKREEEEEGCKYLRLERKAPTKFVRKFRLPEDANPSAIAAKCESGVLSIAVAKLPPPPPEPKSKTVQVKIE